MSRIIYQDEGITEYDDGTEEVHFSDAEWTVMMADPVRFGYVCPRGHAWSHAEREHGHCNACEHGPDEDDSDEPVVEAVEEPSVEVPVLAPEDGDDIPF